MPRLFSLSFFCCKVAVRVRHRPPPAQEECRLPTINGYVNVSGTHFMRNGVAWVPHGLNCVAFMPSPSVRTGAFGTAYNNFSPAELAGMEAWGADTIRFQVSQAALDIDDPTVPSLYDPAFLGEVVAGVQAARAIG